MLILAIETSCDETSVAVVRDGRYVLSNIIRSQVDIHERYGGIVPELASRRHVATVVPTLEMALEEAGVKRTEIDAIAATQGPGLAGALLVGLNVAKGLAWSWKRPLIPVNHIEGHIYSNWLSTSDTSQGVPSFPALCLVVSGGHTELVLINGHGNYRILGKTIDDAAGEAFDKVARILKLGFPGGPAIQKAAESGTSGRHRFPRAWLEGTYDFSFSGVKTALLREVDQYRRPSPRKRKQVQVEPFPAHEPPEYAPNMPVNDIALDFQDSMIDVLVQKTVRAAQEFRVANVLLAGGVAANALLRQKLKSTLDVPLFVPPLILCTDNAAMIASAAYHVPRPNQTGASTIDIDPQLGLRTAVSLG